MLAPIAFSSVVPRPATIVPKISAVCPLVLAMRTLAPLTARTAKDLRFDSTVEGSSAYPPAYSVQLDGLIVAEPISAVELFSALSATAKSALMFLTVKKSAFNLAMVLL